MGRIRILSDEVANKIAAGEVVERPASVVKELLENSLDAGATRVRVEVDGGGRRLIRVADDGGGMLRDDAMLAFERHATSKLKDAKDLLSIATLGFRGEALPSIASVSRLRMETRSAEEATGTLVEVSGGKMLRCDETALAPGTAVTVRDLFFNVPARKKFLRSDQTELAHIASHVTHYALAYPERDFELWGGSRALLEVTRVATLEERVYQVFGGEVLAGLIDLEAQEKTLTFSAPKAPPWSRPIENTEAGEDKVERTYRLRGFVSRPQVQKLNRNSIYLFVNRRLIRDRLLLHALSAAYQNLLPAHCFPFALLFLECDCEEVDVNVHPSKTEVRFRHQTFVHDFTRDVVREALLRTRPVSSLPMPAGREASAPPATVHARPASPPQQAATLPYSEFTQQLEEYTLRAGANEPEGSLRLEAVSTEALPEFTLQPTRPAPPRLDFSGPPISIERHVPPEAPRSRLPAPDSHGALPPELLAEPSPTLDALADLRPLGQLHNSFIIAAGRDGLWIVDQHVAHERILFERILRERANGHTQVQRLLTPLLIDLSPAQYAEYERIAGELAAMGFESGPFGPRTIAVHGAPAGIAASDIEKLLNEILETSERELRGLSMDEVNRAIAASLACRAAIKINMPLDQTKMVWLLSELARTQCPMSCPHGRPIAFRYSTRDILRGFQRI